MKVREGFVSNSSSSSFVSSPIEMEGYCPCCYSKNIFTDEYMPFKCASCKTLFNKLLTIKDIRRKKIEKLEKV